MNIKLKLGSVLAAVALITACQQEPSLQKYFVEKSEQKDFVNFELPPSLLAVNRDSLSAEQITAVESFKKINVLAFQEKPSNKQKYVEEREKVTEILKDPKYQQLMKFGKGKDEARISYVGKEDHIEEFIIYANQSESGFAVVRILGKDMNPTQIMMMAAAIQSGKLDMEQLKPLRDIFGKSLKIEAPPMPGK